MKILGFIFGFFFFGTVFGQTILPEAVQSQMRIDKNHGFYLADGRDHKKVAMIHGNFVFPGYDLATRVLEFEFKSDYNTLYNNHVGVLIPSGYKNQGRMIFRGLIIGNVSQHPDGTGCQQYPAIQFETFNRVDLHHNPDKCGEFVLADTWHHLKVYMSATWIVYKLYDEAGNMIVSDGINATAKWYDHEQQQPFFDYPLSNEAITIALVNTISPDVYGDDYMELRNIYYGYFYN
ncbi:hypothetical protein CSB11_00980 [Candidatus Campbellbacteria bacterium]|nr:MAG: hypothetical protein CSB11_00980 [Candidatus Campbellbacteria bacterium]